MSEGSEKRTYRDRIVSAVVDSFWVAVGAAIFAGPPVYVVYRVLQGGPLLASKTVTTTKTVHYGILTDVASVVLLWVLALVIVAYMTIGPRRF